MIFILTNIFEALLLKDYQNAEKIQTKVYEISLERLSY